MKRLAIFVMYSRDGNVCPNAMAYVGELSRFYDDVVVSSNIRVRTQYDNVVSLVFEKNAYDFGYFYQALELLSAYDDYDEIGFFNDSNYIISGLDSVLTCKNGYEYYGVTDSFEKRPDVTDENQYHIQSHFLIFSGRAIRVLREFLKGIDFASLLDYVGDMYELRAKIIINCELRLTQYMRSNKIRIGSCFSAIEFVPNVSSFGTNVNMHVLLWDKLIERGYPFIKKKLVHRGFSESDNAALDNTVGMTKMSEWRNVLSKYTNPELLETINKI